MQNIKVSDALAQMGQITIKELIKSRVPVTDKCISVNTYIFNEADIFNMDLDLFKTEVYFIYYNIINNKIKLNQINKNLVYNLRNEYLIPKGINKHFLINFKNCKINKFANDTFLLEVALAIYEYSDEFNELLNNLCKYITTITNNTIKILSFISLGIFSYYCKNINKYPVNNWMNLLVQFYMSKDLDSYLIKNNITIDNLIKTKFIFMLVKYENEYKNNNTYYNIHKICYLDGCFIQNLKNTKYNLAGTSADQLLIIVYDIIVNIRPWFQVLINTCFNYVETKRVSFITSWFYFNLNPNSNMYKYFTNIDKED